MEKNYSKQMDIIKGLGIIAIVLGHTESPLHKYVFAYHVVLFFFVSGVFYKDLYSSKPLDLLKKRLKTLYLPFIVYELIFLIFHNLMVNANLYSAGLYSWKDFGIGALKILTFHEIRPELLGQFWFIKVLFIVNITFSIIGYIFYKINFAKKELARFITISMLFIADIFLLLFLKKQNGSSNYNPPFFTLVPPSLLAFYGGYIYKKYESFIKPNGLLFFSGAAGIILICQFVSTNMGNFYLYPFFFVLNSIFGIYCNLYAARIFDYKFKNNLLIYIGKNSLIILALHMISFKLVDLIQITVYNLDYSQMSQRMINGDSFWWVIYTLFGVFVPLGIAAIFNPGYDFFKKSVLMKGESVN